MKQLFVILLLIAGPLSPPVFSAVIIPACGDQLPAAADTKQDKEEEEPDCD
jgi:hypothetical protein